MALWTFDAVYDADARVWVAMACDLPGLAVEAETLEAIAAQLDHLAPLMVEENAHLIASERRAGPHEFRLVAHHEMQRKAAA